MRTRYLLLILAMAALAGCGIDHDADHGHGPQDHSHSEDGHHHDDAGHGDHDTGHSHSDAAHSHSEGDHADGESGHWHSAAGEEHAAGGGSWAVTAWGEKLGLFPEIDALVAGSTADAHVHVTILDGFTPATEGAVTIILRSAGGREERFTSSTVVRPGIFNVAVQPDAPGERELIFDVDVGGVTERIPGGRVRVGTAGEPGGLIEGPHALPEVAGDEEVELLLEQQWRTGFATAWAERGALRPSVSGTARVEPPSGGSVVLTAPVDGVARGGSWPHLGQTVASGDALLSVIQTAPSEQTLVQLEASVREIEARSEAVAARAERLEALLAKEAVSRREVEQVRAEAAGLEARLDAARDALATSEAGRTGRDGVAGLAIRAPFTGRVAEVLVSPGQQVAAGTSLLRVVRERPVWVRVALTPDDAGRVSDGLGGLIVDTGGAADVIELGEGDLRLVAVAPEVNPRSGTVEVLVEVDRSVDQLKPGLRATAQVLLPGSVEGVLLPDSAVVDDAGVPVTYVQLDGETFARRVVTVERRQGDRVLVDGVLVGERVVTVGGAAIRRAALLASGSVEGHVH